MHRTKIKRITPEASLLKKLREQRKLSMREAGEAAGKSVAWISHVENGRVDVSIEHIRLLVPLYGQTERTFKAYLKGSAFLESPIRKECLDAIQDLPDSLIESLHPLIISLSLLLNKQPAPTSKRKSQNETINS